MDLLRPKVVFTQRAYLGIVAETYEKIGTETGGVFLGKYVGDTWYVLESLDPGPNSIFQPAYFEYDEKYLTHLANKMKRFYKHGFDLVGLWHRHPGSFSSFSTVDDGTNIRFAEMNRMGALSALVNLDPDFRLTLYHVAHTPPYSKPQYTRADFSVNDELVPTHLLELKTEHDLIQGGSRNRAPSISQPDPPQPIEDTMRTPVERQKSIVEVVIEPIIRLVTSRMCTFTRSGPPDQPSQLPQDCLDPLLELIESEIEYLRCQHEYEPKISMNEKCEVIVMMRYCYELPYYPPQVRFNFGISQDYPQGYVIVGDKVCAYTPRFIHEYIGNEVNRKMNLLGA